MFEICAKYDAVLFADSDDELLPSRVAAAREGLHRYELIGCALDVIDEQGKPLGVQFGPPSAAVDWTALLPRNNILGLSNTAYRCDLLARSLPFATDCQLADWYLATRAWASGARLGFDPEPRMRYRQYRDNTARVLPPFTGEGVLEATGRVLRHYELMLRPEAAVDDPWRGHIEAASADARLFAQVMRASRPALQRYVEALNRLPPRYVWWWAVANLELANLWRQ
jgi:hypothetical protein